MSGSTPNLKKTKIIPTKLNIKELNTSRKNVFFGRIVIEGMDESSPKGPNFFTLA